MFESLSDKFSQVLESLKGNKTLSEQNIEIALQKVKEALLEADVSFDIVKEFLSSVKQKALGLGVVKGVTPDQQFIKIVHEELVSLMGTNTAELPIERALKPLPILIVGPNGQGKTTFCNKLGLYLKTKKKKSVYLIPADNFRPAAKLQLITHAKHIGLDYFDSDLSLSPLEIVKAGMKMALELKKECVIIDTAGRLQVDERLMQEVFELKNELKNLNPEIVLVADAMMGQEAVSLAQEFHQRVQLTGLVLSKMDSDARGGAALSLKKATGVPIYFLSTGEKMKDLELFHPDRMASRILDMGDVVSLVEKAEEEISQEEAATMMKNFEEGKFTLEDFLSQMEMVSRMGPLTGLLKMIPGMGGALKQIGDISNIEKEIQGVKVIANSMTRQEKRDYKIIESSRAKRIAKGSGTTLAQVQEFLKKFSEAEKMMKQMSQMTGGLKNLGDLGGLGGLGNLGNLGNMGMPNLPGGFSKQQKKGPSHGPWGKKFFK